MHEYLVYTVYSVLHYLSTTYFLTVFVPTFNYLNSNHCPNFSPIYGNLINFYRFVTH